MSISATLAAHALEWRDMAPHTATLTRLAQGHDRIVEFGVRGGVSTWALLDGLPTDGLMWSVDIDPETRGKLPRRVTADKRWTLLTADDLLAGLPTTASLILIDTSHEYHHTLAELHRADLMLAYQIVLHDWNLPDVQDAVRGFCDRTHYSIEGIEPSDWGLVWLRS